MLYHSNISPSEVLSNLGLSIHSIDAKVPKIIIVVIFQFLCTNIEIKKGTLAPLNSYLTNTSTIGDNATPFTSKSLILSLKASSKTFVAEATLEALT